MKKFAAAVAVLIGFFIPLIGASAMRFWIYFACLMSLLLFMCGCAANTLLRELPEPTPHARNLTPPIGRMERVWINLQDYPPGIHRDGSLWVSRWTYARGVGYFALYVMTGDRWTFWHGLELVSGQPKAWMDGCCGVPR